MNAGSARDVQPRGVQHCRRCRKLIAAGVRTLCHECAGDAVPEPPVPRGQHAPQSPPRGSPPEAAGSLLEVELGHVLRELPELAEYIEGAAVCGHCGRRPPLEGGQLCLRCQIDALYELRVAAGEAYEHAEAEEEREEARRILSVLDTFDEKRARTATSRINPVGAQQVKNYRYA